MLGDYAVWNCGPDKTPKVTELLTTMKSVLQPALTNLLLPVSSPAYTVFFGDINRAPFVRSILENVANGTPVPPSSGQGMATESPLMFCATELNQATMVSAEGKRTDIYKLCADRPLGSAYIFRGNTMVVLCPRFFTYPAVPVRTSKICLKVDPHFNVFRQNDDRFSRYQLLILVHELVHYYTNALGDAEIDLEPEGSSLANYCMMLPVRKAVNHAYSYIYFVAGELVVMICF